MNVGRLQRTYETLGDVIHAFIWDFDHESKRNWKTKPIVHSFGETSTHVCTITIWRTVMRIKYAHMYLKKLQRTCAPQLLGETMNALGQTSTQMHNTIFWRTVSLNSSPESSLAVPTHATERLQRKCAPRQRRTVRRSLVYLRPPLQQKHGQQGITKNFKAKITGSKRRLDSN